MTSWRPTLPWNSQQKPLQKGRNPKGKDRLTTFRHPFLGAEMLVLGRLTTKKYAQVKLDHFPKQGWKFKKCLKPPPSNKQQTIPQKKQVWQREGLDLDPFFFSFWSASYRYFPEMLLLVLWNDLYFFHFVDCSTHVHYNNRTRKT